MSETTIACWLKSSPLPRSEAVLLLEHICGWTHAQIIARDDTILSDTLQAALNTLHNRRLNGEPMAYLLGRKEFYGRTFCVSPDVLIPRPETEHLLEAALSVLPKSARVWDLGCGSGILAVSLKKERPDCEVWASDISTAALTIAQENARTLNADIIWTQGDWFNCCRLPEARSCDVILSNPPYIDRNDLHLTQGDLRFEPQNALTDFHDGLFALRTIIQGAPAFLKNGGTLLLEHGFDQAATVRELLQQHHFTDIFTQRDYSGHERISGGKQHF